MKKQTTNKQALKNEVNDLLVESKPEELESVFILLSYNGKFKLDKYSMGFPAYDEHNNFSLDTLTEDQARKLLKNPDIFICLFKNAKGTDPKWLKGATIMEVPVSDSQTDILNNFFSHEFTPKVFPVYIYSPADMEEKLKWWRSEERKLWETVSDLWKERLNVLAAEIKKREGSIYM